MTDSNEQGQSITDVLAGIHAPEGGAEVRIDLRVLGNKLPGEVGTPDTRQIPQEPVYLNAGAHAQAAEAMRLVETSFGKEPASMAQESPYPEQLQGRLEAARTGNFMAGGMSAADQLTEALMMSAQQTCTMLDVPIPKGVDIRAVQAEHVMLGYGPVGNAVRAALTAERYMQSKWPTEGVAAVDNKFMQFLDDFSCMGDVIYPNDAFDKSRLSVMEIFTNGFKSESVSEHLRHTHARAVLKGNQLISGVLMRYMDGSLSLDDGTLVTTENFLKGLSYHYTRKPGGSFIRSISENSGRVIYHHEQESYVLDSEEFIGNADFIQYITDSNLARRKVYNSFKDQMYQLNKLESDSHFISECKEDNEKVARAIARMEDIFNESKPLAKAFLLHRARPGQDCNLKMLITTDHSDLNMHSPVAGNPPDTCVFSGYRWDNHLYFTVRAVEVEGHDDLQYKIFNPAIVNRYILKERSHMNADRKMYRHKFDDKRIKNAMRSFSLNALSFGSDVGGYGRYSDLPMNQQFEQDYETYVGLREHKFFGITASLISRAVQSFLHDLDKSIDSLDISANDSALALDN